MATARSTFAAIFGEVEEASVLHGLVFRLCKRCGFEPRSPAPVDIDALVDPPPPTPTPTIPRATRPRVVQPLLEVKCDLCGGKPACAEACPTQAITYIDAGATGLARMRAWAGKTDAGAQAGA